MTLFRRRIQIASNAYGDRGEARAVLEDDFHHFRVAVFHQDGIVTDVAGYSLRNPYTSCPAASGELMSLKDMPLNSVANSVIRATDASVQCTHMLDLAGLAIAAAKRGIQHRRYDIEVPRRVGIRTSGKLVRDGIDLLEWQIENTIILSPAPYAGINLREGMARWALTTLPEDEAEAALVLRRCMVISRGREHDLDLMKNAVASGNCYAQQVDRAAQSLRIIGSTLDFTVAPELLCAVDQDWINFKQSE
ncbi:hypothetical protein [Glaciimonas immobilis]|uniref:DUF2889 domain-containing protein n=1 Tax=Glaciimonas immobilis TaxID=728004 RepID=A0A840RZA7_9BURK|nr:hypothetical protein [Glaciimonas immobilis]KAF3996156.1 hypothetical protein HAV38_20685 [Glaciimonas immobilis]MBB5201689.1 hypothetical protein [Glaciimonas immobilis]